MGQKELSSALQNAEFTTTGISAKRVREVLDYNPENGDLIWKKRKTSDFKSIRAFSIFNSRFAGKVAGCLKNRNLEEKQYLIIGIDRVLYRAHRLAWLHYYGDMPEVIDHVNGNGVDNRIINLREVKNNNRNLKLCSTNKSGISGISWSKSKEKWRVRIHDKNKEIHLGYFSDFDDAKRARKLAESKLGYEKEHGQVRPSYKGGEIWKRKNQDTTKAAQ